MIEMHLPGKIVFGEGSFERFVSDTAKGKVRRMFILCIPEIKERVVEELKQSAPELSVMICTGITGEPDVTGFGSVLEMARSFDADGITAIGGGSIMDTAKLVAAMIHDYREIQVVFQNPAGLKRELPLVCLPTTAGTGSEVSPNALLYDGAKLQKVAVIHPCLVPDAAYVDPMLTVGLPPSVTAFTGLDALTHCIEAYTNRYSHPMTDSYALSGIKLIGRNLASAVENGENREARMKVALGSLYGGLCLGPVNTAAVHALAYPLGNIYRIPHGISNALLLPHVMQFNLDHTVKRYALIAGALGVKSPKKDQATALKGIQCISDLIAGTLLPRRLSDLGIPEEGLPALAQSAMKVERLLKNNPREIHFEDALNLYKNAF